MRASTKLLIATLALASGYAGYFCYHVLKPPVVEITNSSGKRLSNVVVVGDKFSERFEGIEPHQTLSRVVDGRGQAKLEISFTVDSREIRAGETADIEPAGAYVAHITVDDKLRVLFAYSHFIGY